MTHAFTCEKCKRRIERPGHLPLRKAICGDCQREGNEEAASDIIEGGPAPSAEFDGFEDIGEETTAP